MSILERARKGWDVFRNKATPSVSAEENYGPITVTSFVGNSRRSFVSGERSILAAILTRIAMDTAAIEIRHVRVDDNGDYVADINSGLNNCLTVEANIDQAGTQFRQDIVSTLLEEGVAAIVPVISTLNPAVSSSYDIQDLRVGKVTQWYARGVTVDIYNDHTGMHEEVTLSKEMVAIIENPLYAVMNEPNSTYQRLVRKLNFLDVIDEQSNSGKLDIIVQLPYTIKNETRLRQAEERAQNIEMQLKNSKYGIAYIDSTEHITQLNRPAENNLLKQVEYLTEMLYGQMGITASVLSGTATEAEMVNYQNRTIKPILKAITEGMERKFLTKTARTQKQAIRAYQDMFEMIPPSQVGEWADKLTRNEILSSNEVRGILGRKPSADPRAAELVNKNMPRLEEEVYEDDSEIIVDDE